MTPDAQQPEYIITEDELESLYAMTHIKYEQQVTEIHQHVHTRPHTPAPARTEQCCKGCDADMCAEACQTWINEHDAAIARAATLAAIAPIKQVYERFKHLDALLSKRDPDCPMMMCYVDIWEAVKDSIRRQKAGEQE